MPSSAAIDPPTHGVSGALPFRDPDGVAPCRDRPEADRPRASDDRLAMVTRRFDLRALPAGAPV